MKLQDTLVSRTPLRDRATRKRLVHARRRAFERFGSRRYSRPGAGEIDRRLEAWLPPTGVFVEAGANDGYTWSNTYYLERWRGWSGMLVEGIPELARECARLRRRSAVVNCALVAPERAGRPVTMTYSDLRSLITGSEPRLEAELLAAVEVPYEVTVPGRTLSELLDEAGLGRPDFISLDLEGHEADALRGLDLERHGPTWLLVEVAGGPGRPAVEAILGERYAAATELTEGDVLYRARR